MGRSVVGIYEEPGIRDRQLIQAQSRVDGRYVRGAQRSSRHTDSAWPDRFCMYMHCADPQAVGTNGESADNFRAPETIHLDDEINGKDYPTYQGKPLDIWALGITLYIITYLKFPFDTDKGVLELYKIIIDEIMPDVLPKTTEIPDNPKYSFADTL